MSTRHIAQRGAGALSSAVEAPSYASFFPQASAQSALYRQFFTDKELAALDAFPSFSAASEISLLRILIVRLLHAAEQIKLTLKHRLQLFTAFCRAALTMASLARFEFKQQGPPPSLLDLIWSEQDADDFFESRVQSGSEKGDS